jgi:acyl-CoA synthetase (AMP-forming)/AMP-acid ligase II
MLIHDFLTFFAREQPDTPCLLLDDRVLSYSQLYERSNQLANALLEAGLQQGERFTFLGRNSIETVIAYLAGSIAGLVPVPLNWRLAPPEWEYIVRDANARLAIVEQEFCSGMDSIRGKLPDIRVWISVEPPAGAGWTDFEDFCSGHATVGPQTQIDEHDVFYQMYTSGTTGNPKGAMLTHYSVVSNAMQTMPYFKDAMGPGKRTLIVMPMFHAGAASFVIGSLFSGSTTSR